MEYYYTDKMNVKGSSLVITGEESKHLLKVLRKSTGEEIFVTDGERNLYRTLITEVKNKNIICKIEEKFYNINESGIQVTLFQSLLKNPSRFEFVLEKATELGVNRISPITTQYVINKRQNKHQRWQAIVLSAMKQSQRCYLPPVDSPIDFADALNNPGKDDLKLICHEKNLEDSLYSEELKMMTLENRKVALFVGPEGGFTEEEIELALSRGFKLLNLGKRKLRSETAAVAVMSIFLIS